MKIQFITEATRLQKLAGIITESQINENEEAIQMADFLNQHYDEAFNKIVKPVIDEYIEDGIEDYDDVTPGEFGLDPEFHEGWFPSKDSDFEEGARFDVDSPYIGNSFIAQFKPFTDPDVLDIEDSEFENINRNPYMIAGKKVYVFRYGF